MIAIAFNKKTIVRAISNSWGLALIIGAMAAMAVPPQIAAPDEIKNAKRFSIFRILPINNPRKRERITNNEIQGRYTELTLTAYGKLIVAPKITIPICKGMVPSRLEKNKDEGLKKKVKAIPKKIDSAALPARIAIKTINANMKLINVI